jgi:hypothetical protein
MLDSLIGASYSKGLETLKSRVERASEDGRPPGG